MLAMAHASALMPSPPALPLPRAARAARARVPAHARAARTRTHTHARVRIVVSARHNTRPGSSRAASDATPQPPAVSAARVPLSTVPAVDVADESDDVLTDDGGDDAGGGGGSGGGDGSGKGDNGEGGSDEEGARLSTSSGLMAGVMGQRSEAFLSTAFGAWCWRYRGALSSALALIVCDVIAQLWVEQRTTLEGRRILFLGLFGALWKGPLLQWFYQTMDAWIPGRSMKCVVIKLLVDQTAWAWSQNVIFLTYVPMVCQGWEFDDAWADMKAKFWPLQMAAYKIWPLAHIINYKLVPSSIRVLYVNSLGFVWCVIMCAIARGKGIKDPVKPKSLEAQKA